MAISFDNISGTRRTPGFVAEVDNSAAGSGAAGAKRTLLIGQMTIGGSATAGTAVQVTSASQAESLFGTGSMAALMVAAYLVNDPTAELWVLPLDDAAGTAASGTIEVTAGPTANGTIHLYIAGKYVPVSVSNGDATTAVAAAIEAAIDADATLPVTASVSTSTVTVTARNDGTLGNAIGIATDLREGQELPATLSLSITGMSSGATDVAVSSATSGMAGVDWYAVVHPYSDDTNLDLWATEFNDTVGRWSPNEQSWGHAFTGFVGTQAELTTHGNGRNDEHHTCWGIEGSAAMTQYMPAWFPLIIAAAAGRAVARLRIDPARPCQGLQLTPPAGYIFGTPNASNRFTQTERNTLLYDGIATFRTTQAGAVQLERCISTYQTNPSQNADDSFLDVQTLYTLQLILEETEVLIEGKYGDHKLANDGTQFGPGQKIVTPKTVRNALLSKYRDWENRGLVENFDAFATNLIVERNDGDPNRLDILLPPDLVNQLRVTALKLQFRLQY